MCSFLILSLLQYNNLSKKVKNKIFNKLSLRGPDEKNIIKVNGYVFIHFLLHFCGDVTKQPYYDEKNQIVLCYNGEIYNYKSFGDYKSDTEMIINQYKKNGIKDVTNFDGEFTFAIFDFKNKKIIQSSDIFATKPQWFYENDDGIIISSLRSSILKCLYLENNSNKYIEKPINNKCNFINKDIYKLEPNKIITKNLENYKIISNQEIYKFDLNQHKNNFKDFDIALENAIIKRVRMNNSNNQKIGLCLSGGYDSGAISCCLNKHKLKYVSYTMKCKENMKIVNKRLKLIEDKYFYNINQEIYNKFKKLYQEEVEMTSIKRFSKPNKILNYYNLKGDWAGIGLYYIFSESKKDNVKIFLSGQGADEIFSDYGWKGKSIKYVKKPDLLPNSFLGKFPKNLNEIFPWPNFFHGLNECFIAKEEYTASLFGIETRYPFLDKMVVQEFLWLNNELKNKYYKAPLFNYLNENKYPFDVNKKQGFKAKVVSK